MQCEDVNLASLARESLEQLRAMDPERRVELVSPPTLKVRGDARLLRIAVDNLIANAWKFTRRREVAVIEIGRSEARGQIVYHVRDNGVGFDMRYSSKLFAAFQRLHPEADFEGTGIGLATVQRVVARHGGSIWADAHPDRGATFHFTLPNEGR
jgi:light-regulated signal transduction histidine kinase (bacteriophytochrome)